MKNWTETLSTLSLGIAGTLAIGISILDTFFNLDSFSYFKDSSQVILLVLGFLTLAVGLERKNYLIETKVKIDELLTLAQTKDTALQFLDQSIEILTAMNHSINEAEHRIYILSFDLSASDGYATQDEIRLFDRYIETLINTLKTRSNIDFRIVFGCQDATLPDSSKEKILKKKQTFIQAKVDRRARFRYKQSIPVGFTIIIVDDKNLLISFPCVPQDSAPRNMIRISTNSNLANRMAKWYEEYVWNDAQDI